MKKFIPGGYFSFWDGGARAAATEKPLRIKNTLVGVGASNFLRTLFRGESVLPTSFYLGLTNSNYNWDSTIADLAAGEPTGNGYARQELTRNTTDWTVQEINGFMQALSKIVSFTASGDWDKQWLRMFICDVASGTSGDLYSVSGPAPALRTVLSGAGPSVRYEYYLRG